MDESAQNKPEEQKGLLDNLPPLGYMAEWQAELARPKESLKTIGQNSMMVFRLGTEWFSLPTATVNEVVDEGVVHEIPHRSGTVLRGLVNIRGKLQLCVSLHQLLGIQNTNKNSSEIDFDVYRRMIAFGEEGSQWVFAVEEAFGSTLIEEASIQEAPASVTKVDEPFIKGLFLWKEQNVAILDIQMVEKGLLKQLRKTQDLSR